MATDPLRIVVLGGGGHGRVVADIIRATGHTLIGFADADERMLGTYIASAEAEVLCSQRQLRAFLAADCADAVVVAIGDNDARLCALRRMIGTLEVPSLIHPSAQVDPTARIEEGTVVMPRAVIGAAVVVGRGVIVNTSAQLDEGVSVGDGAHISPGAILMPGSRVRMCGWVGAGAIVEPNVVIGRHAIVGAGALVTRDVKEGATAVGLPAQQLG